MDLYSGSKYHLPCMYDKLYTTNNHFASYKYQLLRLILVSMYFITKLMILQCMLYRSSQVGMEAGLYFTLVSLFFFSSAITISISNIFRYYFYTSFCGFSDMDFDSVLTC